MLAGLFQIGLGLAGIGKYIKYIPYPVVSGFMTAIGIIILFTQIAPAMGYDVTEDKEYIEKFKPAAEEKMLENILTDEAEHGVLVLEDFQETIDRSHEVNEKAIFVEAKALAKDSASGVIGSLRIFPRAVKNINWLEMILAFSTVFIIFGFKRITKVVPSTLVALFVVSGIAIGFNLDYKPIQEIPSGIPMPRMEIFSDFSLSAVTPYLGTALILAFLGAIDSLLTSVVADNMTKTKHKPNKELIGQGIGNSVAALFGGIPGAGATIRTVVNINAGGKTRLSGMIAGLLLLVVLLALGPIASKIPAAVLAGILITVGISVMDYKGLKAIPNMPRAEVIVLVVVLVLSVTWNLVYAVGIGLVIASIWFMKKMGDLTSDLSYVKSIGHEEYWPDERNFPKNLKEEVYIKHVIGPLFFGSTSDFQALAKQIPKTAKHVILRLDRMGYIDQSGLYAMEDIMLELVKNDVTILIVHIREQPRYLMERIDIIPDLVPEELVFEDIETCFDWIQKNVKDEYTAEEAEVKNNDSEEKDENSEEEKED